MFRPWREDDLEQLIALCNAHDSAIDPEFEDSSAEEIREELNGFYDEVMAQVYEEEGVITDLVTAQVDKKRERVEIDVFGLPEKHDYARSFELALSWANQHYANFEKRAVCNSRDAELRSAIEAIGFLLVRRYWTMRNHQPTKSFPKLPKGVSIRQADFDRERAIWHRLLMDSFSGHYGFKQRGFEEWEKKQREQVLQDPEGVFFLEEGGVSVGLLVCTNHRAKNSGGFIDKIGVLESHRGRGYGELLLRWGCAYSVARGFSDVALAVDTGNATGAVALYEKAGFRPMNVWLAFSDSEELEASSLG